ncbi:SAM-dependent methyltransferase [Nocardia sp. NBC_00508]|uniref:SAM-dependent methyltransferase n=1 Tax=Nocardia sp. NBC_00508 TaxID=2975992 RepID=UPI002E812201|nr:SAM-dependent methyltransferase [Nocardia sp. NBC_00508]WUD65973.1 SAM-dependent methyltransferase [Nocardia sp. NBC_00508]
MESTPLHGIGTTALGVAALRALEHDRPDRLFSDPYAQCFLDAAGGSGGFLTAAPVGGYDFAALMADQVAIRTRFFDEVILDAAGDTCTQVVLVASGLDTRPYRLAWPGDVRVFEIDFGDVLRFKRDALTGTGARPACAHIEVPADLLDDWPTALRDAGFSPDVPTIWLLEGILYALPADAADQLIARITALSAPGCELAADHAEDSPLLRQARAAVSDELVRLWRGGPVGDLGAWFGRHGWVSAVRDIRVLARSYHRPVPRAFDHALEGSGEGWLVTARLRHAQQ